MKHSIRLALVTGLYFLLGTGVVNADPAYDKCINASSDNASWGECGGSLIAREDGKLNAIWKQVYGQASGQTRTDLLAEQRQWITFKEASCKFYANGDFGREGAVLDFPTCRADIIAERTKALQGIGQFLGRR